MDDETLPGVVDDGAAPSMPAPPTTGLGLVTLAPRAESVRAARRFVEQRLVDAGLDQVAEDAGLLTTELAANAVLHARTDFDVVAHRLADGARVEVRDRSGVLPVFTAPSATAMGGRGLLLVQTLATGWGGEQLLEGGKSVWFEVARTPTVTGPDLSVDELLAAWADDDPTLHVPVPRPPTSRSGDLAPVPATVLVDIASARDLLAAKEHLDDLLRELQLVLLDADGPGPGRERDVPRQRGADPVAAARRLDASAQAFDAVRRQVREQVSRAAAAGREQITLHLELLPGDQAAARDYRSAVEDAEVLALGGGLLTTADDLGRHSTVRQAYLDDLIAVATRH